MEIDYIVHGYGEIAMGKLASHLSGKFPARHIPGISYIVGSSIVTNPGREFFSKPDDMPLPAYHLIDMEHYATVNGRTLPAVERYLNKTGKSAKNHRMGQV